MRITGRRAWRALARSMRRSGNRDRRKYGDTWRHDHDGAKLRRRQAEVFTQPTAPYWFFTPRSAVGMSQAHRKWLAMFKSIGQRTDYRVECGLYRVGERLRPCPGCCACKSRRYTVRIAKKAGHYNYAEGRIDPLGKAWVCGVLVVREGKDPGMLHRADRHCDGSGVIPARSQVNAGQEER